MLHKHVGRRSGEYGFIADFDWGVISVEADGVEKRPVALILKFLQQLLNVILHVVCVLDLKRE